MLTLAASRPGRETKCGLADLVAGEAAVLGSCRGARPSEGSGTLALNGLRGRIRLAMDPVL